MIHGEWQQTLFFFGQNQQALLLYNKKWHSNILMSVILSYTKGSSRIIYLNDWGEGIKEWSDKKLYSFQLWVIIIVLLH